MHDSATNNDSPAVNTTEDKLKKKRISMHEDIPVWYDCCSCEAEPYWIELFNNMDIDDPQDKS